MEGHIALVTQQLHVSILLAPAHTARAEAALHIGLRLAVLTLRPALPWQPSPCKQHTVYTKKGSVNSALGECSGTKYNLYGVKSTLYVLN